jgi:hypothetical protein
MILILDFDLTITDIHTGGQPVIGVSYWKSVQNEKAVANALTLATRNNWYIYIATRGNASMVRRYIRSRPLFKNVTFKKIYGTKSNSLIALPNEYWAEKKLAYVNRIYNKYQGTGQIIYFIDDTDINIRIVSNAGYNTRICVGGSLGLIRILEDLDYEQCIIM